MVVESPSLSSSVLLLNRLYMALRVIPARRAMSLVYRELAEVVAEGPQHGRQPRPLLRVQGVPMHQEARPQGAAREVPMWTR